MKVIKKKKKKKKEKNKINWLLRVASENNLEMPKEESISIEDLKEV